MAPVVDLPNFTIMEGKRHLVVGFIQEEGNTYAMIVLDGRLNKEDALIIVLRTEDDFARLWDTLEREFSDIMIAQPRHWEAD